MRSALPAWVARLAACSEHGMRSARCNPGAVYREWVIVCTILSLPVPVLVSVKYVSVPLPVYIVCGRVYA